MVQTCVLEMRYRLFSTLSLHCDFSSYLTVWLLNLTSNDLSCFNRMKIIQSKIKDTQTNFLKLCSQSLFFLFFSLIVLFIFIIPRLIDHRYTISVWMFPAENSASLWIVITDILLPLYIQMAGILAVLPKISSFTPFQWLCILQLFSNKCPWMEHIQMPHQSKSLVIINYCNIISLSLQSIV